MNEIIQSIFLGTIQGASEFLPISSSGHLILIPRLLQWKDQGLAFDVALHLGTLIAVLAYFWNDWIAIIDIKRRLLDIKAISKNKINRTLLLSNILNSKDLLLVLIISTIPGMAFGLLLNNYAESYFRNPVLIACTLFIGALLLIYSDRTGKKQASIKDITIKKGIYIGAAQAIAIIPGVSRSGITITVALLLGLDRASAAKFSFLLSTPIILGAGVMELPVLLKQGISIEFISGILFASLSGYLAIKYMIGYVAAKNYDVFVAYRIILAIIIFILFI